MWRRSRLEVRGIWERIMRSISGVVVERWSSGWRSGSLLVGWLLLGISLIRNKSNS